MDDETYIDFNGYNFAGNKYYYDSGHFPVEDKVKYKEKTKFPQKLLVWVAISKKGRSSFLFRPQKEGAINGQVYAKECMRKRLIPWIKKHYPDGKYIFWPDLASSHYANPVLKVLADEKIKILDKNRTLPMFLCFDQSRLFGLIISIKYSRMDLNQKISKN